MNIFQFKKLSFIITAFLGLLGMLFLPLYTHAQLNNAVTPFTDPLHSGTAEKIAVAGLTDAGVADGGQKDALINVIKGAVNWVLGIMGLIALLVLLYGGFQMVTASGNEEQYGQGFKIMKQASVGLAIVGFARFIVSIIFFLIELLGSNSGGSADTNQ